MAALTSRRPLDDGAFANAARKVGELQDLCRLARFCKLGPDLEAAALAQVEARDPLTRSPLQSNRLDRIHVPATRQALVQVLLINARLCGELFAFSGTQSHA
jgi:hypothetical protein